MALAEVLGSRNLAWVREDYRRREWGGLNCETAPPGVWDNLAQALQAQERRRRGPVLNLLSRQSIRTLTIAENLTGKAMWIAAGGAGVGLASTLWNTLSSTEGRPNILVGAYSAMVSLVLVLVADHISTANRVIKRELSRRLHRQ